MRVRLGNYSTLEPFNEVKFGDRGAGRSRMRCRRWLPRALGVDLLQFKFTMGLGWMNPYLPTLIWKLIESIRRGIVKT